MEGVRTQHTHNLPWLACGAINALYILRDCLWVQALHKGDRVGLLLDLEQGSMTVFKNGLKLGVMQDSGLRGEYVWAVEMLARDSVRIDRGIAPLSPSRTELEVRVYYCVSSQLSVNMDPIIACRRV